MRRTLALLGLLAFPALPITAQNSAGQLYTATRQQLDVTKIVLARENAWNKGDLDAYVGYYKNDPETEAILNGPVRGVAAIRNSYHASFPNRESMGTLEQSSVEVHELGTNYAFARGHYKLVRPRKSGGDAEGNFTEIFEKTEAGWKLIFSETS